ncbi:MAG: AMP-binding protein [Oscillospiraceae bacterium]|jgi:long-chain acyl-CoA synthetase|nr:AMP-binding protein [Oscillospiraceae bacterium]
MLTEEINVRTIPALLDFCQTRYGSRCAFRWRAGAEIHDVTYQQFAGQVRTLAAYIAAQTARDDRIALVGGNSYRWLLGWFAVVCAGRVSVPIDPQLPTGDILALLAKSGASLLLHAAEFGDVAAAAPRAMDLERLPVEGEADGWPCAVQPEDLGAIVFTSGTTGVPKGVLLTHWNFMADALSGCRCMDLAGHTMLAVLPFHHTLSLTPGMLAQLPGGSTVCICGGMRQLTKDLAAFQPEYTVAVPLLAEGMYRKIWDTAQKEGKEKLLRVLLRCSDALLRLGIDLRRKLFKSVLDACGGLKWMLVGGAPLSAECADGFLRFGLEVLPAYGVSECAPGVALNRSGACKSQSVGQVLDCCRVKIVDGEIWVKGDNVSQGYYQDEAATQEAFTQDGWHKTGDLGLLDADGYLYITGRRKNLIVLRNGKNVSPEGLEQKLTELPCVQEALVYQEGDEIVAELYLDTEERPDAEAQFVAALAQLNRQLPAYQRITKHKLRDAEFPKTTTKKIIRK